MNLFTERHGFVFSTQTTKGGSLSRFGGDTGILLVKIEFSTAIALFLRSVA
jgi:hypothetical protein